MLHSEKPSALGFFVKMTATAHALIGAAIAAKIVNPWLAIPLAIVSHIALDLVPHWDAGTNKRKKTLEKFRMEAVVDVLLGFLLSYVIFWNRVDPVYMFIIIIASQLPDWLQVPTSMFNIKVPPFTWVYQLGHKTQTRMQLPWGLVTQIVIVGIIVSYAFITTPTR